MSDVAVVAVALTVALTVALALMLTLVLALVRAVATSELAAWWANLDRRLPTTDTILRSNRSWSQAQLSP